MCLRSPLLTGRTAASEPVPADDGVEPRLCVMFTKGTAEERQHAPFMRSRALGWLITVMNRYGETWDWTALPTSSDTHET